MKSDIEFKIQYSNSELGEFQFNSQLPPEKIIEELNEKTKVKGSQLEANNNISFFLNKNGHYLRIHHYAKDVFYISYSLDKENRVYEGHYRKTSIDKPLNYYLKNNFSKLKEALPRDGDKQKDFLKTFNQKPFIYVFNLKGFARINQLIFYSFPILVLATIFIFGIDEKLFQSIIILSIFTLPSLLLIRLYLNHKEISKDLSITISRRQQEIIIKKNSEEISFNKREIEKIIIIDPVRIYNRNPFDFYGYTEIHLKDESKIIISNLIIELYEMEHKFSNSIIERINRFYPYIKEKMWLTTAIKHSQG